MPHSIIFNLMHYEVRPRLKKPHNELQYILLSYETVIDWVHYPWKQIPTKCRNERRIKRGLRNITCCIASSMNIWVSEEVILSWFGRNTMMQEQWFILFQWLVFYTCAIYQILSYYIDIVQAFKLTITCKFIYKNVRIARIQKNCKKWKVFQYVNINFYFTHLELRRFSTNERVLRERNFCQKVIHDGWWQWRWYSILRERVGRRWAAVQWLLHRKRGRGTNISFLFFNQKPLILRVDSLYFFVLQFARADQFCSRIIWNSFFFKELSES